MPGTRFLHSKEDVEFWFQTQRFFSNNRFELWSVILLSVLCYYLFKAEEGGKKNENEDENEDERVEEEEEQVKILKESELRPERKPSNSNMKPQAC